MLEKTQCLPLYRYTPDGQRVSNITDWAIRRINEHYRAEWGDDYSRIFGDDGITAEDIFAYTYAVLHDSEYREKYAVDLLREFPRLPLYRDFDAWKRMGQELLDLHIGFESADPLELERVDRDTEPSKAVLRADKDNGAIVLDANTTLTGVPESAWGYRLGSRSALEWVLDQYKERKPPRPHHSRQVQHLPLRRPQGPRHRPSPARLHRERRNGKDHRRIGQLVRPQLFRRS